MYQQGCHCEQCREAERVKQRKWRNENKQWKRDYEKARKATEKAADPVAFSLAAREKHLRTYGLTVEQWESLFDSQGRCCAICDTDDSSGRWHTDHDPEIGKHAVRGILCVRCNIGIGQFKHDPHRLRTASRYVVAEATS